MRKSGMGLAAIFAIAAMGTAQAVHLDANGRGQVLLYPYYTVNNGQQTLLSVTNTSAFPQMAQVNLREGYNGRDTLQFKIYLAPFDSWNATMFALSDAGIASEGAGILTRDSSCTVPSFSSDGTSVGGTPYVRLRDVGYTFPGDGGPTTLTRTREGYLEVIALANLGEPFAGYISHGSPGNWLSAPTGCSQVTPSLIPNDALSTPAGGLVGSVGYINVGQGTYLASRAEALAGFTSIPLLNSFGSSPALNAVNDGAGPLGLQATAHVVGPDGTTRDYRYPGSASTSRRVDAVSAALMAEQVYNEYQVSPGLAANSDWMVTFPTKPFYTDPALSGSVVALEPFVYLFSQEVIIERTVLNGPGQSCVRVYARKFNNDSRTNDPIAPPDARTQSPSMLPLCTVVNSISLGDRDSGPSFVLGSNLVTHLDPGFTSGWMNLKLDPSIDEVVGAEGHRLGASEQGDRLRGLPAIGFWASNIVNGNLIGGVLANYATTVRHVTSSACVKADSGAPCD